METTAYKQTFIKFIRDSKEYYALIKERPTAFVLLSLIVQRARRTDEHRYDGLEIGQALIGDYKTYGVKRQVYRDDISFLQRYNFATIKGTSKGTIARLLSNNIFDINVETKEPTVEPLESQQRTTNKNEKNEQEIDTKSENQLSYLLSIPSGDLLEFSNKYSATQEQIKLKGEDLHIYCKAHGKTYSNYKALLSTALNRNYGLRSSLSTFPERPGFVDAKALKYH